MAGNKDLEIQEDSFSSDAELDEEADEESSTDVDAKLEEDDVFDVEFFKCYSALKTKDQKIYDQNMKFFEENESEESQTGEALDATKEDDHMITRSRRKNFREPKMTLLDHQLAVDPDRIEEPRLERAKIDLNNEVTKSFYEKELEEIKKSIEKVGEGLDSESDDDLFVVKGSSEAEKKTKKPSDKLKTILDKIEDEEDEDLQHLKKVWSDPKNLSAEDRFLRDYILNKSYLPRSSQEGDEDADDEDNKDGFFSKDIEELSDIEDIDGEIRSKTKLQPAAHHSDEKDFDKIARIPRNSTKTIRDLVERQEKKEKRLKKIEKVKKKKKALKNADCEDILGDLHTKFHYRETEPNDYGLSAEELLLATDEELDKWVSLRDCIAYKTPEEERMDKRKFESKKNDVDLKRKIFKSIYGEQDDQTDGLADQSAVSDQIISKQKKRRTKKRKRNSDSESSYKESANDSMQGSTTLPKHSGEPKVAESNRQRKKRKKKRGLNHKKFAKIGVAPDRLLAYGISKTKLKKSKIL